MPLDSFKSPEANCYKNTDREFYREVAQRATFYGSIYQLCFSFLLFGTNITANNHKDNRCGHDYIPIAVDAGEKNEVRCHGDGL